MDGPRSEQSIAANAPDARTARAMALVAGSVLVLVAATLAVALGGLFFRDHDEAGILQEPALDLPALLGPWQPRPIGVPVGLKSSIETTCRSQWRERDLTWGREHRGPTFLAAVVDARGGGRATLVFRSAAGELAFCIATLGDDGGVQSVDMATFGGMVRPAPDQLLAGPGWSDGAGEPGSPVTRSGPIGVAGEEIRSAVLDSVGHPRVVVSIANGAWAFWVPWDWEVFNPTIIGLDAAGLPIFNQPLR